MCCSQQIDVVAILVFVIYSVEISARIFCHIDQILSLFFLASHQHSWYSESPWAMQSRVWTPVDEWKFLFSTPFQTSPCAVGIRSLSWG